MNRRSFMRHVAAAVAAATIVPIGFVEPNKIDWTVEIAEDFRSVHNLAAEKELTELLAHELNLEIDREVLEECGLI